MVPVVIDLIPTRVVFIGDASSRSTPGRLVVLDAIYLSQGETAFLKNPSCIHFLIGDWKEKTGCQTIS